MKKQLYRCYALSKHWELKQRLADDSSVASLAFNALGACGYPNASLAFCSMATQMLWRLVLFFAKLQHLGTFSRAAATSLQPCHLRWHHHILHWVTGLILQRAASLQVNCFTSVTAALRSRGRRDTRHDCCRCGSAGLGAGRRCEYRIGHDVRALESWPAR